MNDTHLWKELIKSAYQYDHLLARNLEGIWLEGTKLIKNKNGKYVLRPFYGKDSYWKSEKDYKKYTKKYLEPYRDLLIKLLKELE